jgi:hypothetical protein
MGDLKPSRGGFKESRLSPSQKNLTNNKMLNTKIGENYNANDVINSNDLRKRILNIDSRFRTSCTDPATNFQYKLEHPYKNIIRLRVASVEIPNMFYTFSKAKKNVTFIIKAFDITGIVRQATIELIDGNYNSVELINEIQLQLDVKMRNQYGIFLSVALNAINAKVTFINNGTTNIPLTPTSVPTQSAKPFVLDFISSLCFKNRLHNFGLGYNLGFRQKAYKSTNTIATSVLAYTIEAEACLDVVGDTYIFLAMNDLHTVEQKTNDNYLQVLAKIIVREDKYAVIYDDGGTLLANEIIFPSPVNLSLLNIQLLDAFGEVIDLCGMNFSFSLEITEVLNTRLYDFYRNYIWSGTIPTVNYKTVTGSAQPLLKGYGPPF